MDPLTSTTDIVVVVVSHSELAQFHGESVGLVLDLSHETAAVALPDRLLRVDELSCVNVYYTDMSEKAKAKLREIASAARGGLHGESRNVGSTIFHHSCSCGHKSLKC